MIPRHDGFGVISFNLGGLLERPLTSGLFMRYGREGPGKWISIYANDGHVFMVVAEPIAPAPNPFLVSVTGGVSHGRARWKREEEHLRGSRV
jgi:hypothetical protein